VTEKPAKQGTETLVDNFSFNGSSLAQAEYTNHRLLYLTPVLTEPAHISGVVTVKIRAASSKPAVNLSVWLVALPWSVSRQMSFTDNIITRGWADLQNYRSMTESEPLFPVKFYEISFDLEPDDHIIPAGKQIGLMLFSSDKEFTLHPMPGTELTIDLDGTEITIPIVGGKLK